MPFTKAEVIEQLNVIGRGRYIVHDIPNYENEDSRCIVECIAPNEPHGLGTNFLHPWYPTVGTLKNKIHPGCPKCAGNYRRTETEALSDAQRSLDSRYDESIGKLTVIGIDNFKNNSSRVLVHCSNHGNCWEFGTPFKPTLAKVICEVKCCPKCSNKYKRTKQETMEMLVDKGKGRYTPTDIENYRGLNSKVKVICHTCGPGWLFKPRPWKPTVESLLANDSLCPRCSGNYNLSYENMVAKITAILPDKVSLVTIPGYTNIYSKVHLNCDEHGNCWEWATPWIPTIHKLESLKGCLKCIGKYERTESEWVEHLNSLCADKIKVEGLKTQRGNKSKCRVTCEVHGPGWLFGNPWEPSCYSIEKGHGCPKCSGGYRPSVVELIDEINSIGKEKNFRLVEAPTMSNAHALIKLQCAIDGTIWEPSVTSIRHNQSGCPLCGRLMSRLSEIAGNAGLEQLPRNLYWVNIQHQHTDFWKIGVAKSTINKRYLDSVQKKDGVTVLNLNEENLIKTTNILALLTEAYVIRTYANESVNKQDILKHLGGGTECFNNDVLGGFKGLIQVHDYVKENQEPIMRSFGLIP